MRLPWFSSQPKRGKGSGKSRRRKPASLRVRPLERRRVLNASIQSIAVPAVAAEGSSVTATANASGQGQLNYNWSFTQGNTTLATGTNPSFNFTVPDDGNYNVSLTVTDNSPVSDSKSVGITGKNVAPVLSAAKDQTVDEGHSLDLTGNGNPILGLFIDDGKLDTHTATVDWGDGSPIGVPTVSEANGSGTLSGSHTYAEVGTYTVSVNVQDNNGGASGPQTFKVLVNNVPPQLINVTGSTINENGVATVTATIQDPGTQDTFSVAVNWQDFAGDTITGLGANNSSGFIGDTGYQWTAATRQLTLTHQYVDDGPSPGNGTLSDTYHVALTVTDNHLDSTSTSVDVIVNNVNPILTLAGDQMLNEGQTLNLSGIGAPILGFFTDAGTHDKHIATVDWGDGSGVQTPTLSEAAGSGVLTGTHLYADDGTYTVTATVTDDDGGSDTKTFKVTVKNVAPTIDSLSVTTPISENDFATLKGTYHDPGVLDTQTLDIDWDGDGNFDQSVAVSGGAFSIQHQYLDDGPSPGNGTASDTFTVHVRLRDNGGDSTTGQTDITVNNIKPVLTATKDKTVDEGQLLDLTGNANPLLGLFIDTGTLDQHTATVDWGDGSPVEAALVNEAGGSGTLGGSHTYADNGIYTVKVTVSDDDLGTDFQTFKVTVNNVPPQLVNVTGSTIDENSVATITAKVQDPGVLDTFSVDVNWQDGSATDQVTGLGAANSSGTVGTTSYQWTAATRQITLSHQYLDDGISPGNGTANDTYHVALTVSDNFPASRSTTADVIVNNLNPVLTVTKDKTVDEGQLLDLTGNANPLLGLFIDTGTLDQHTATVDWGDGSPVEAALVNEAGGSGSLSGSHTYADNGIYTVKVTVSDDDLGTDVQTFKVTVNNVPPQLVNVTGSTIDENSIATITAKVQDPGVLDTFSIDVNWQDGSATDHVTGLGAADSSGTVGTTSYQWTAATRQLALSHQYLDDGASPGNSTASDTYHVALTVTDNFPASTSTTADVTVNNIKPVLTATKDKTVNEGQLLDLTGNANPLLGLFIDTGTLDQHTATVDWGDGSPVEAAVVNEANGSGSLGGSHTYADDGIYTVKVTVSDDDLGTDVQTFKVTVNNVDPTLTVTPTPPTTIFEGSSVAFNATFSDPGFDNPANPTTPATGDPLHESFTYDVNWGDGRDAVSGVAVSDTNGSPGTPSTGSFNGSHTYADDGTYTVTVTIHDDNGGSDVKTFTVTVNNQDPSLTVTPTPPTTIFEGSSVAFNATFSDPGFDNPNNPTTPATGDPLHESFTYDVNWGDGRDAVSGVAVADTNGSPGTPSTGSFNGSHTYADDGTYTVTVTIHDDNGGSDVKTFTVTVNNQNPTLTVTPTPPTTIFEGSSVAFNATFSDPGFDNPNNPTTPATGDRFQESFTYDVNWGDGRDAVSGVAVADTNGSPGTPSTGSFNGSHTYADDGTYTVTVTIHDDNGGSDVKTFTVTVNNQNPTLTVTPTPPTTIFEGSSVAFNATFSDPGFDNPANPTTPATGDPLHESFTYDVNWGDGRDAVSGVAVADTNGSPGTPSTGSFNGSHTYADDGTYTVTVTIHDDNGGSDVKTFTVTVNNVDPTLTGTSNLQVNEGHAFTLKDLGVGLEDPGFDNPNNPTTPATGDPLAETFTAYTINWGDGQGVSEPVSIDNVNDRVSGSPGVKTTAKFTNAAYTYADDGTYTVTITLQDDNGPIVARQFQITVKNVIPTLTLAVGNQTSVEAGTVTLPVMATFTDPGFDNPNNPTTPALGDPQNESFRFFIDWGDGREQVATMPVADTNGGPGVLSSGQFGGSHNYADNGTYTVTLRIADDNMSGNFAAGTVGTDYVEQTFKVTVSDIAPSFVKPNPVNDFTGTAVDIHGFTSIKVAYSEPGYDNFANASHTADGGQFAETPVYVVDWGDGTVDAMHHYAVDGSYTVTVTVTPAGGSSQTFTFNGFNSSTNPVLTLVSSQTLHGALKPYTFVIDWGDNDGTAAKNGAHAVTTMTLMLADPGIPVVNSGLTKVMSTVRTPGQGTVNSTVATTGSAEIQHRYVGPPDPLNPTANIEIQTTVFDDDGLSTATSSIFITNPGINSQMIRIDTTPDIARLEFPTQAAIGVFVGPQSTSTESLQNNDVIAAAGEMAATADRYLELRVVYPDGTEGQGYRMKDEALNDLRGFFKTLPDGRYRVYLVRTENNSRRLVIEVNVRRGNVIDVSDESEGTRDRPPTSEDQGQQPKPLNENPQLEAVPGGFGDTTPSTPAETATAEASAPAAAPPVENHAAEEGSQNTEGSPSGTTAQARRAMPLAIAGIAASSRPWSEEVDEALAGADDESWQRLRRAVRRGRFRNPSERRVRRPVGRI